MTPSESEFTQLTARVDALRSEVEQLKVSLYGDGSRHIQGLLEQFGALRQEIAKLHDDLSDLIAWRREMTLLMRAGLAILSVGGGAQIMALLKAWGI